MTAVQEATQGLAERMVRRSQGPGAQVVRRFFRQPIAVGALGIVVLLVLVAVLAPWIAPFDPATQDLDDILASPSAEHWLGTDDLGRDVFSRVIHGARISLGVSVSIVTVAMVVALVLGLVAGYRGGRIDSTIMRSMDVLFAFPPLILALTVRALLGPSLRNLVLAIAVVFVPSFVRLIRGQVLSVREELYIEAAVALGSNDRRIIRRHVLPNVAGPIVVQGALALGFALLAEAGLSFLGFGAPPPAATWGTMLRRAFDFVLQTPYQVFIPGGAITLAVLAYNLVGDGVNQALGARVSAPLRRRGQPTAATVEPARPADEADRRPALEVTDLGVELWTPGGWLRIVDGVSFSVERGETLGLVGESGCGKTVTALAVMGLLPRHASRVTGSVRLEGRELLDLSAAALRDVRGRDIAMVFQDPLSSLNPSFTVGNQLVEAIRANVPDATRRSATRRAVELLDRVGIPDAEARLKAYPHELSGGMRQRVTLGLALAGNPTVLVADEPTTALDVTIQAQVLDLLRELQRDLGLAIVFVTHDLGVIAELSDDIAVMYAGELVERGDVQDVFSRPLHPYTQALLEALPEAATRGQPLGTIPGAVPAPGAWPPACRFAPRCPAARDRCRQGVIESRPIGDRLVRCVRAEELELRGVGPGGGLGEFPAGGWEDSRAGGWEDSRAGGWEDQG